MKDLKNLTGAKQLSKMEQRSIKGGLACRPDGSCPTNTYCCYEPEMYGLCRSASQTCF